jgi:hypothetical protein
MIIAYPFANAVIVHLHELHWFPLFPSAWWEEEQRIFQGRGRGTTLTG